MSMWSWIRNAARTLRGRVDQNTRLLGGRTHAGKFVDEERALRYSAVWSCVQIISESIAMLPWCVYRRTETGREEDIRSTIYWILHTQPNPEMTSFSFKELMVRRTLLSGNAYAEIERDAGGRPLWLWPLDPLRVRVERDEQTQQIVYRVDQERGGPVTLQSSDVFHLKGPGGDGITGVSMIRYAAESIGLGIALDDFGSSFFGNGAHASVIIKHPQRLSDQALEHLKKSIEEKNSGGKALSPMILEEGMSFEKVSIPPEDAQFLESRKWQILDIARWYRVPAHKLGIMDRATYTNIEQSQIEFVSECIVPWCVRMEQEADRKLYGRNNRGLFYTKMDVAELQRGDMKSRYDSYAVGRQWGWLSANDVRAMEDWNPVKGGDIYMVPVNMTTPEKMSAPTPQLPGAIDAIPGNEPTEPEDPSQDPALEDRKKLNGRRRLDA